MPRLKPRNVKKKKQKWIVDILNMGACPVSGSMENWMPRALLGSGMALDFSNILKIAGLVGDGLAVLYIPNH